MTAADITAASQANYEAKQREQQPGNEAWGDNRQEAARSTHWNA